MAHPQRAALFCVLAATACSGGCAKKVALTFTNITSAPAEVELIERDIHWPVGVVGADGGRIVHKLEFDKDFLPRPYTVRVGEHRKPLTIDKKTKSKLYFHLTPGGLIGPVDHDAKVRYVVEEHIEGQKVGPAVEVVD